MNFAVAFVATGIKKGVSIHPFFVNKTPAMC
jgi:hypothetical protein